MVKLRFPRLSDFGRWPNRALWVCLLLSACAPDPEEARQILALPGASGERVEAAEVLFAAASPADLQLLVSSLNDFDVAVVTVLQQGLAALASPANQAQVIRAMAEHGVAPEIAAPVLQAYGDNAFEVLLSTPAPSPDFPAAWRVGYLGVMDVPAARAMLAAGYIYGLAEGDDSMRRQAVESLVGDAARVGSFLEGLLTTVQGEMGESGGISAETAARMGITTNPEPTPLIELARDYLATAALVLYRIDPERHAVVVLTTLLLSGPPDFGAEHLKPLASMAGPQVVKMIGAADRAERRRAVALAGMWGLAEAAPQLRAVMSNGNAEPELRGQAALALSGMRDPETLKLLPEVLRQAHDAGEEWRGYRAEGALLAAEKEACDNTESDNSEEGEGAEDGYEDDSGDAAAEYTEDEDEEADEEDWGCAGFDEDYWGDSEPLEQPLWPDGDYESLHRNLLQALLAYGEAALPALWRGLSGDEGGIEDEYVDEDDEEYDDEYGDEYGENYEMGYISSSEVRDALKEIAPGIDVLLAAWTGSKHAVRSVLLDSLGQSADPRVTELLLGELQDSLENSPDDWAAEGEADDADAAVTGTNCTERLVLALQTAPQPPIIRLLELAQSEGESQQLAAIKVLSGLQSDAGVFAALLESIHSKHAPVRAQAARAFEQSADRRALEALAHRLEKEDQYKVELALAGALRAMPDVLSLPGLMKALANLGEWDSAETFALALGEIKDAAREPVVALYDTGTGLQRRNALLALAYVDPTEADRRAGEWFDRMVAKPADYQINEDFQRVVEVLHIVAQPDGARRMVAFLQSHPQDERRMEVLMAVKDYLDPQVHGFLMDALHKQDLEVVAAAYTFFIRAGSGEEQLVEALDQYGDAEMATAFLNCGNSRLEKAANDWVESHDAFVLWNFGTSAGAQWGVR